MSMQALLAAVVLRIRSACGYSVAQCDIEEDGHPPATGGQAYAAVHPAGIRCLTQEDGESLDEECSITVTLTLRDAHVPLDRAGRVIVGGKAPDGLYPRAEAIAEALHFSYAVLETANKAMLAIESADVDQAHALTNGFIEPLRLSHIGAPEPKWPDWWGSESKSDRPAGHAVRIELVGARRVRRLDALPS